jgi:hypothetical protein
VDTPPDGQGGDSLSRQRPGRLNAESTGTGTCPGAVSALQGRDPVAALAAVASESMQLRQITASRLRSNDRDA